LLASFQNARPGTPKVFGKMMIEEVYAHNPNACVLESACRRVVREKDFPPSIAEVLKAIKEESSAWCDRWELLDTDPDFMLRQLENAITEAEPTIAPAEAKLAEREAKARAEEEQRKAYRDAYNRIPQRERDAHRIGEAEARAIDAGRSPKQLAVGQYIGQEPGILDAYLAGFNRKPIPGLAEVKTNGAAAGNGAAPKGRTSDA